MNNWLKNIQLLNWLYLTNRIFTQSCVLCQANTEHASAFCQDCLSQLPITAKPYCKICSASTQGDVCGSCLTKPPHYDETQVLFSYQFPVDSIVKHYKYHDALYLSHTFGLLLAENLDFTDVDLIIPMPLHPNRIKVRGFNQSLEIAKVLAKQTNIRIDMNTCQKVKDTPPQATLAYKDRIKNIKNAFQCSAQYDNMHIAIIDDVMTSGATLNELARILKQAGANKVSGYILARAQ